MPASAECCGNGYCSAGSACTGDGRCRLDSAGGSSGGGSSGGFAGGGGGPTDANMCMEAWVCEPDDHARFNCFAACGGEVFSSRRDWEANCEILRQYTRNAQASGDGYDAFACCPTCSAYNPPAASGNDYDTIGDDSDLMGCRSTPGPRGWGAGLLLLGAALGLALGLGGLRRRRPRL